MTNTAESAGASPSVALRQPSNMGPQHLGSSWGRAQVKGEEEEGTSIEGATHLIQVASNLLWRRKGGFGHPN